MCRRHRVKDVALPRDEDAVRSLYEYLSGRRRGRGMIEKPLELVDQLARAMRLYGRVFIDSGSTVVAVEVADGVAIGAAAITHDGHVVKGLEALDYARGPALVVVETEA